MDFLWTPFQHKTPRRARVTSGNSGPGHLGYWNPNGVNRADALTPDGSYMARLLSPVAEGTFKRIPTLKFVLIIGGVSWLVPIMWRTAAALYKLPLPDKEH